MATKNGVKAIACEMCGSNDVVKQDGMYVCQFCNTKYSVEEARKLMVEGTVKIDGPVEVSGTMTLEKMVQNGETFLKLEKFDDALRVFTEITEKYPEDYRGWWGKARAESNNLDEKIDKYKPYFCGDIYEMIRYHYGDNEDYVTNSQFIDAWKTALSVISDNDISYEIEQQGHSYLVKHKKENCKAIINYLSTGKGAEDLSTTNKDMTNWRNTVRKEKIKLIIYIVLFIASLLLAILLLAQTSLLFILFGALSIFIFFCIRNVIKYLNDAKTSYEINYNIYTDKINGINTHKENLSKM